MRSPRYRPAIVLLILLAPCLLSAQRVRTLSLDSALRLADEQSLDVRSAQLALDRTSRQLAVIDEEWLPSVTAQADYQFNIQRPVLFIAPGNPFNTGENTQAFPIGSRHATALTVDGRLPLYNPRVGLQRRLADAQINLAQAQLEGARALVRQQAERSFYRALYARAARDTRDSQISRAQENLDFTLSRFRQGRSLALDTLTATASLARARADAERARYDYLGALFKLAQILDITDYRNLDVTGELALPEAPGPTGGDPSIPEGRVNGAEARVAEAERSAALVAADVEGRDFYPTIDAIARWQALGQSAETAPTNWSAAMTSFVGVTASLPISNLWRGDAKIAEAQARVAEAELHILRLRREDSIEVETLLLSMQGARAQIVAEEATVIEAKRAVQITSVLYREGRATWLDVETAQSRLLDAELAVKRATLEFLMSYADLKALAGE